MSDLEKQLTDLDAQLEAAQKIAKAVVSAVNRTRAAIKVGRINDIVKGLNTISQQAAEADRSAASLANAWTFDTAAYMANGQFLADLQAAASEQGLKLFERNGRIYCFPLLLRIEPNQAAVKIGKRRERRIRPGELAKQLASLQKKPQRFREERFLRLLYDVWRRLGQSRSLALGGAPVVSLAEIYETLTLLPDTDYPEEEFARDLLLLDRKPDLRTSDGARVEFPGSTLSKGRMRRLVVYDEGGAERTYIGVRFVKEEQK